MRHTVTGSFHDDGSGCAHFERIAPIRDDRLELVVRELQHRMRNILSIVLCFVNNTDANTTADFREALSARIATLSDAYRMIDPREISACPSRRCWSERSSRMRCFTAGQHSARGAGPHAGAAHRLGVWHAHHSRAGYQREQVRRADIDGRSRRSDLGKPAYLGGQGLAIERRERGGPIVTKPERRGFGTQLIARALPGAQVDLDFAPDGLVCRLLIDLGQTLTTQGPVS